MNPDRPAETPARVAADGSVLQKPVDRRGALTILAGGVAAGTQAVGACSPLSGAVATEEERELKLLEWHQFIQKHYRWMTEDERAETS